MKAIEIDQAQSDLEEICRLVSEGKRPSEPELAHRVEERAAAVRAEDLRLFGVREVAVDIVREIRDSR